MELMHFSMTDQVTAFEHRQANFEPPRAPIFH